jgi:hypothetical protein
MKDTWHLGQKRDQSQEIQECFDILENALFVS